MSSEVFFFLKIFISHSSFVCQVVRAYCIVVSLWLFVVVVLLSMKFS